MDNGFLISCIDAFSEEQISVVPKFISEFVYKYLNDFEPKKILDLGFNIGSFINPIAENFKNSENIGIIRNDYEKEIIDILYKNQFVKWYSYDYLDEENNEFDVIVGNNKFESELKSFKINLNGKVIHLEDDINFIEMLKACFKLNSNGIGFFLLDNNFLLFRDDLKVISNLEKFGVFIDSILEIPSYFLPIKESDKILLIIKNEKPKNIFIGQLEPKNINILIENLKNRSKGKIPEHGALTDLNSFYTFKTFIASYESRELAKKTGLDPIILGEISEDIIFLKKKDDVKINVNAVFLPLADVSTVFTSSDDFEIEKNNYVQIVLKDDLVLPEYLAHLLNTPLGKKIRKSLDIGMNHLNIQKEIIYKTEVFIPDWNQQIEIISVNSLIMEIITRADTYKKKLWKLPKNVAKIKKEIEALDDGESEKKFEQWIETLPYPLASILWASITNSNYDRKVKYLLHFFEAFSEFNFTLMLSGLSADKNFFNKEVNRCFKEDYRFINWYFKPTFGNWYNFGSCLSKTIRRLLKDEDLRNKCLELFGNPDPDFLIRIANKDLIKIFVEVTNYRNQWEGHGPIVSDLEYENRYKILRSILSRVYNLISDSYENSILILPIQSSFQDGIHDYSVKRFMSTRGPFKPDKIETINLLDKGKIYLVNENQHKPVELLPFIILKDEACYFYNGKNMENWEARYVSYHHSEEPEILVSMDKFKDVITLLKQNKSY